VKERSNYAHKEHGEVESSIATHGHEVLRKVFQGYLDQKTKNEAVQLQFNGMHQQLKELCGL
jgi:hypothetical protein